MEINTGQPIGEDEKSCITCQGHGGVSKRSRMGCVEWVIECTINPRKKEDVDVSGTAAEKCSKYALRVTGGGTR